MMTVLPGLLGDHAGRYADCIEFMMEVNGCQLLKGCCC